MNEFDAMSDREERIGATKPLPISTAGFLTELVRAERARAEQAEAERDQLRQQVAQLSEEVTATESELQSAETERDALQAWKDAVPVGELRHVDAWVRQWFSSTPAIWARVVKWLATLDGAQ